MHSSVITIFHLLLLPDRIYAHLKTCTNIGKLSTDRGDCIVLLPSGRLRNPMNASNIIKHLECDDYLVSLTGSFGQFVAWEKYKNFPDENVHAGVKVVTCRGDEPCKEVKYFYYQSFSHCSSGSFITYAGYTRPGFMALFECSYSGEKKYHIFYYDESEDRTNELKIDTFPDIIAPSSFLYTVNPSSSPGKIFAVLTSNLADKISPVLFAVDRKLKDFSKIITKSNIKLESNKSIPCSRSNECGNQVFFSYADENSNTHYILSLSIEDLNSGAKETILEKVYEASSRATFDTKMVGVNVFNIEYPYQMIGFVVKSGGGIFYSDSWHLLFLGENEHELGENCFAPESKLGNPFFCPLSIPSGHTLKYISTNDGSLWMHTSSEDFSTYILRDQSISTCFLMNDCFGCVLLSTKSPFECKWDGDRCISSSSSLSEKVSDCVKIKEINVVNSTQKADTSILKIKVSGVCLINNHMNTHLLMGDGKKVQPNKTETNGIDFFLDYEDEGKVRRSSNKSFLVINCTEFATGIKLVVDFNLLLNHGSIGDKSLLELLLIIALILVISFLVMFIGVSAHTSRSKQ